MIFTYGYPATNSKKGKMSAKNALLRKCRCGGKNRSPRRDKCKNIVTDDTVKKPDLAIYSQLEIIQNNGIANWDSPDIITNDWRPFRLKPEAEVKVRNISPDVPAINAQVHYAISAFGIGTKVIPQLIKSVSIAPNSEVELTFPLAQTTLNGDPRVGVHIRIEHPHDENLINNSGSQVHDGGYTSESGRNVKVHIPIYNDSGATRQINLSIMPTDLVTTLNSSSHIFAPNEQISVELTIEVPNFLHGTPSDYLNRAVTIIGRLPTGELVGGVTRLIRIDD
jgi:hypothetical protein